jgi:DNA-binding transcriptional LysR family regulator
MFTLNQLSHFQLVTETGNFAEAARRAHITQPALSNSIRALENRTGVQLLDRSARPIKVTSAGRDLQERISSLLKDARNLERAIGYLSKGMSGSLNVGMTAQSSGSIGGAILGSWQAENRKMSADVTVADSLQLLELLRAETLDLIIADERDLPRSLTEFNMQPLQSQRGCAFCRKGHPVLNLKNITFNDLMSYRFATSHFPKQVLEDLARTFQLDSSDALDIAIQSDNLTILRDAMINSDLILLSTPACVRSGLDAHLIEEIPIELNTPTMWHCITLKDSLPHPAIASLRAAISKTKI